MKKPIRIDWEELDAAFNNKNGELVYYLDLVTGHVVLEGEGEEADFDEDESQGRVGPSASHRDDGTRAYIEPLSVPQKIEWMKVFVDDASDVDSGIRGALREALAAPDPAEALAQVIRDNQEAADRWYLYRAERLHRLIEEWLARNEITPVDAPPWKG